LKCVNIVLWGSCASPGLVLKVSRLSAATFLTGSSVDGPELLTAFDAETIEEFYNTKFTVGSLHLIKIIFKETFLREP
jgi:hypothetical protein